MATLRWCVSFIAVPRRQVAREFQPISPCAIAYQTNAFLGGVVIAREIPR